LPCEKQKAFLGQKLFFNRYCDIGAHHCTHSAGDALLNIKYMRGMIALVIQLVTQDYNFFGAGSGA
jgi:hypothetical protein